MDKLRSLPDFYGQVVHNGFACGYDAGFFERGSSHWHEFHLTGSWMMDAEAAENQKYSQDGFTATVRPLHAWLTVLTQTGGGNVYALTQPKRLWPVCYGGNFAATAEAVRRQPPQLWAALEASLARGPDSLEEGHFAERSWAGLMALPPTPTQEASVRQMAYDTVNPSWCNRCAIVGQLLPACGAPACRSSAVPRKEPRRTAAEGLVQVRDAGVDEQGRARLAAKRALRRRRLPSDARQRERRRRHVQEYGNCSSCF